MEENNLPNAEFKGDLSENLYNDIVNTKMEIENTKKNQSGRGRVSKLLKTSFLYAKFVCSIPSQSTYKNQSMNVEK